VFLRCCYHDCLVVQSLLVESYEIASSGEVVVVLSSASDRQCMKKKKLKKKLALVDLSRATRIFQGYLE
jgi:hypothetical protein